MNLVVAQRPIDRLVVDLHIRQQIGEHGILRLRLGRLVDGGAEFGQTFREPCLVRLRHRHAGRRHRAHIVGGIVLGTVRQHGGGEHQGEKKRVGLHAGRQVVKTAREVKRWNGECRVSGVSQVTATQAVLTGLDLSWPFRFSLLS